MKCKCFEHNFIDGVDVEPFVLNHLVVVKIDPINWETEYICPTTKIRWLKTYTHTEAHGGGTPHLKKIKPSCNTQNEGGV